MKKEMVILKFGGSLITDKRSNVPRTNDSKLKAIGRILNQNKYNIIIVHGAGSFGHPIAKKYNIAEGTDGSLEQEKAISETRSQVQDLNNILCNNLNNENINTKPIIPSKTMTTKARKIIDFPFHLFDEALKENKIPVTFGDVTEDKKQGVTVLSGDTLMMELTKYYRPLYSIFVMDKPGVFNGNPKNSNSEILPIVNKSTIKILEKQNRNTEVTDVTGGLIGKIQNAIEMAEYSETWITNLDLLSGFFNNNPRGSKVVI